MAKLVVYRGRTKTVVQELRGKEFVVGRLRNCHLQLEDRLVSRRHARFYKQDGIWWVEDLETLHGTWRDYERITKVGLIDNDILVMGQHLVVYQMGGMDAAEWEVAHKARKRMTDPGTDSTAILPSVTVAHLIRRAHLRSSCHLVVDVGDGPEGIKLEDDTYTVGFGPGADVRLGGRKLLAPEVLLLRDGRGRWFASAGGRGAVSLNGESLVVAPLEDGALLEFGGKNVRFHEALLRPTGKHAIIEDSGGHGL
ncbi:MAG: FHA domain-containing protein [Proteobacteria bacterium]|nr:FHA domain-containing protein [Pseudomonadota bacterium]